MSSFRKDFVCPLFDDWLVDCDKNDNSFMSVETENPEFVHPIPEPNGALLLMAGLIVAGVVYRWRGNRRDRQENQAVLNRVRNFKLIKNEDKH